jgi:hypothetical protein
MPRRNNHVLCHCSTCHARNPNGVWFDQDRLSAHIASTIAEKEASPRSTTPPPDDLPAIVASQVLAMTLNDEGPDLDGPSRVWASSTDLQQDGRLPDFPSAALPTVDDIISGVNRLAQDSGMSCPQSPPLTFLVQHDTQPDSIQGTYSTRLDYAALSTQSAEGQHNNRPATFHTPPQRVRRERNHLTARNLLVLERIKQRIVILEDSVLTRAVTTWESEANRLQHALDGVRRQTEVVQQEKERLLVRLRVLRHTCAAPLDDQPPAQHRPVEYNTGERVVTPRSGSPLTCH